MANQENKTIELNDGKIAVIKPFKGKHILEAQKLVGTETEKMMFGLIAQCVTIDGKAVLFEEVDDMPGGDVLKLMGEFGGNF
jgi:hypothetical protein